MAKCVQMLIWSLYTKWSTKPLKTITYFNLNLLLAGAATLIYKMIFLLNISTVAYFNPVFTSNLTRIAKKNKMPRYEFRGRREFYLNISARFSLKKIKYLFFFKDFNVKREGKLSCLFHIEWGWWMK